MGTPVDDRRKLPIFIHSVVDDMTDITPNAMRVYMHLARRAGKSGMAFPSYQSIGDHCFTSVSANVSTRRSMARKAIAELITHNLIEKKARQNADGDSDSNGYIMLDVQGVPIDTPMPIDTPKVEIDGGVPNKHTGVPNKHTGVPIGTKDTPIEDTPIEDTPNNKITSSGGGVPDDAAALGEVYRTWEQNMPGSLTQMIAEQIAADVDMYGASEVIEAIRTAVMQNVRKPAYVRGVLQRRAAGGESVYNGNGNSTSVNARTKLVPMLDANGKPIIENGVIKTKEVQF